MEFSTDSIMQPSSPPSSTMLRKVYKLCFIECLFNLCRLCHQSTLDAPSQRFGLKGISTVLLIPPIRVLNHGSCRPKDRAYTSRVGYLTSLASQIQPTPASVVILKAIHAGHGAGVGWVWLARLDYLPASFYGTCGRPPEDCSDQTACWWEASTEPFRRRLIICSILSAICSNRRRKHACQRKV